ncbi:MAG: tyrosine-type recombinase/integrase [Streptosporangiaceae bacterium]
MLINLFSAQGWESWGLEHCPLIPERMPVLIDDDLLLEDGPAVPRATVAVNRWLRELPVSGAPASGTWLAYARIVRDWIDFLAGRDVGVFDCREVLKSALSGYAEYRAAGPVERRLAASTWNQHVSVLGSFYRWAVAGGQAQAEPFTYRAARGMHAAAGQGREARVNAATRRRPKPHVTIRYLEPDFTRLFLDALAGLDPDGRADAGFAGRELARNHAVGQLAVATGLRLQEFTFLLAYEIPPLPRVRTGAPVAFPVPSGVTKGRKFRTTWISYEALATVHQYLALDRAATADSSAWSPPRAWGEALPVTDPDAAGGRISGARRRWDTLTPAERRRLVAPGGGSCLVAVRAGGGPFTAWASVFERTADRIRACFEPRFPHVNPHRTRHTFAMRTLEYLVSGYYRQAAVLAAATGDASGPDAALALYLSRADPLLVLRDLLGHSSVLTTEKYLSRLDTTRIFRDACERSGLGAAPAEDAAAGREAAAEFEGDDDGGWS